MRRTTYARMLKEGDQFFEAGRVWTVDGPVRIRGAMVSVPVFAVDNPGAKYVTVFTPTDRVRLRW